VKALMAAAALGMLAASCTTPSAGHLKQTGSPLASLPSTSTTSPSSTSPMAQHPRLFPEAVAFSDPTHGLLVGRLLDRSCFRRDDCRGAIGSTSDGGRTWTLQRRMPVAVTDVSVLAGTPYAWATVGSRIAETTDRGRTWSFLPKSRAKDPSFATPKLGLAVEGSFGGVDGLRVVRTSDGGVSWTPVGSPCRREVGFGEALSFPSPSTAWLLCTGQPGAGNQAKEVFFSTDAGTTWHLVAALGFGLPSLGTGLSSYGYPNGISFLADGEGWMTDDGRGYLYESNDGGSAWHVNHLAGPEITYVPSVSFVRDELGWALRWRGDRRAWILKTSDGGATWTVLRRWHLPGW
jgi:hypothetical protein